MTTTYGDSFNATPTAELPAVLDVAQLASIAEQYCSRRKTPRHRLGERRGEVHAIAITGVVLRPRPPSPGVRMPAPGTSLLAKLLGGGR
ncbi:hypothetical protein [Pseudonocardia sp. 73-21]|uniref:hypothetical protein n=1 Tax=Pseudonocardia sp. 73-21 TaxID=1895809 RepID=UPI000959ED2E|nr:hypothetical protein [Pseudonocardia sp. 73-21]OJY47643.1 MAG: hypothetical protein BGP03_33465 [Pseudonocardia sp. 73-21]